METAINTMRIGAFFDLKTTDLNRLLNTVRNAFGQKATGSRK
jgi:hypothetical protein